MAEEIIKVKVDLDVTEFSKNAKAMSDALSKVLGKEIELFNGRINKTTKLVENTEKALGGVASAANKAGNSIKQSNQQWTNLALIIQDLPFGFRGIQNNLPALVGGFASMTGPIYLAASAIIALFTAIDTGLIKFGNSLKLNTNFSKEASKEYNNQIISLQSLYRVATDANRPMEERILAAKALKEEYPGLLKSYSDEDIALGKAKKAYEELNGVLWQYAKAKAAEKALEELASKQIDLDIRKKKAQVDQQNRQNIAYKETKSLLFDQMTFVQRLGKTINDLPLANLQYPMMLGAMKKSEDILSGIEKEQNAINKEKEVYLGILDDNITAEQKLKNFKKEDKKPVKIEDNSIELLKAKQEYYKDDIFIFLEYEKIILEKEKNLAVARAKQEGKSNEYILNITKTYAQKRENAIKNAGDKWQKAEDDVNAGINKIYEKNAEMINDAKNKINQQFLKDDVNAIKSATDVKAKLDKGNIKRQINDYQEAIDKLKTLKAKALEENPLTDTTSIDNAITDYESKIAGLGTLWGQTAKKINDSISNLLIGGFTALGEGIGKALAGENFDALSTMGSLLATALTEIGTALISFAVMEGIALELFKDPAMWPVALAAGIAAVAAGAYLKSKMGGGKSSGGGGGSSLNYGNVNSNMTPGGYSLNRPNFSMLGQYPSSNNASNVPSVSDTSDQGATFVLKGQDLLLSVNRAQKASKLKGQNINLG